MACEQPRWKMILILSVLITYFFGILSTEFHHTSRFNSRQTRRLLLKKQEREGS